jgi:hypothetical protein
MILLSIANGLFPQFPPLYAGIAAWLAGLILLPAIKRQARLQFIVMFSVGAAALFWAAASGRPTDWGLVLTSNQSLLAMLAAVSFLRLITLPAAESGGPGAETTPRGPSALTSTLIGVHLFGSVINLSALTIMGDRLSAHRPLTPTQAQVLSRGFSMAASWSPFFAAMGLTLTNAPGAQLSVLVLLGLPVAALALGYTAIELGRRPEAAGFEGYPMHFGALWVPASLALCVMLAHQWRPQVPILTLVALLSVTTTLVVLLLREWRSGLRHFIAFVMIRLGGMANELALFLAAGVLASGISAAVATSGLNLGGFQFGFPQAAGLLVIMIALSALGIHPVICISTAGGLLAPLHPDPNLLGMVFLMTWALGIALSPISGTNMTIQGRYGIDAHRFLRWHARFALFVLAVDLATLFAYTQYASD